MFSPTKLNKRIFGIWIFITGIILVITMGNTVAETVTPVNIRIASVCRYHIERTAIIAEPQSPYSIESVKVSVLSNSERSWQLAVAYKTQANLGQVHWSVNGLTWRSLDTEPTVVLTGQRSQWNNYRFYLRYQGKSSLNLTGLQYQMLIED